jgi:hypothetical protein
MKTNIIATLFVLFNFNFISVNAQPGFIHKKDAKNLMQNGVKEGNWIEYLDFNDSVIPAAKSPSYYQLTIYKDGKPTGIVRCYYMNGNIFKETPYIDGQINGVQKGYYEYYNIGKIGWETPYVNNKKNGLQKDYYYNGQIESETPYTDDKINGTQKLYYENGKIKSQTTYIMGNPKGQQKYDENGNEIKTTVTSSIH